MNMILHDVHYQMFDLRQADTLEDPLHEGQIFEAIVANPPFSAKWSADPLKLNAFSRHSFGLKEITTKYPRSMIFHLPF